MDPETAADFNTALYCEVQSGLQRLREGTRLVHYTSAENALNIITGGELWMRNCTVMNDFSEVEHGQRCISVALQTPEGQKFRAWLDDLFPGTGFAAEVLEPYSPGPPVLHREAVRYRTFILSLSEHTAEDVPYGRLSMWRAYGAPRGTALILNPKAVLSETGYFEAQASPVLYKDVNGFLAWFGEWTAKLENFTPALKSVARDDLKNDFVQALRIVAVCTKHPAFAEEREWRVVHTPAVDGPAPMATDYKVIRGVPQLIMKIKLENVPAEGVTGMSIPELVEQVLLGPMEHPGPTSDALVAALTEAGVEDPWERVKATHIPLRQ